MIGLSNDRTALLTIVIKYQIVRRAAARGLSESNSEVFRPTTRVPPTVLARREAEYQASLGAADQIGAGVGAMVAAQI